MQERVRMSNFICQGLVTDLKKMYNINDYRAIKARESYE